MQHAQRRSNAYDGIILSIQTRGRILTLAFQGFVRYSDVFGRSHITGFLAQFVPTGNAWVLRGGDEYNYSRDEDPNTIPEWTKEAMES